MNFLDGLKKELDALDRNERLWLAISILVLIGVLSWYFYYLMVNVTA